ncbi:CREB/ATF bZIP transcription factor [Bombina bombina]|uniref:CREB/ATF bZIP transcription factor n=1 Tax=Bombina bombina TaxID=8345 RepID=UPI00235AE3B4|nr:CREB/ATF bZIP transcription factor [Bombina bombina]
MIMRHRLRDRANLVSSPASRRRALLQPAARIIPTRRPAGKSGTCNRRVATVETDLRLQTGETPSRPETHLHDNKDQPGHGAPYEGAFLSGMDFEELLGAEGEAAEFLKEADLSETEDVPLADLLQQIVGCVDVSSPYNPQAEIRPQKMAAITRPSNMAAAALSSRTNGRCQGNKNALAARLNRLRKKEYVNGLESRVARLSEENQQLQVERRALDARVRELEEEARYLRAVLANDSALSQLLGRLTGLGGLRLSTSLFGFPPTAGDHDYALPRVKHEEEEPSPGGVCLHVDKEKVSVEFCALCARNAFTAVKM